MHTAFSSARRRSAPAFASLLLVVAACGGADRAATETPAPDARGGEIGAGYVEALDDAAAVDELARDRKARLDAAAESPD